MKEEKLSAYQRIHHLMDALADVPDEASDEVNPAIMQERDRLLYLISTVHHSEWPEWWSAVPTPPRPAPRPDAARPVAEETNERK